MKERLATEKLYLEDEIRLDYNNGNMVGEGAAFQLCFERRSDSCAHRCNRSDNLGKQARKGTRGPGHSRVKQPQQG